MQAFLQHSFCNERTAAVHERAKHLCFFPAQVYYLFHAPEGSTAPVQIDEQNTGNRRMDFQKPVVMVPLGVENIPRFYRGKKNSFSMRLPEGKQIP